MRTSKNEPTKRGFDESYKDRLIPFPTLANDPLWPLLARHRRNPFVEFLRTVFFYEDEVPLVTRDRVPAARHYYHGKPLAH